MKTRWKALIAVVVVAVVVAVIVLSQQPSPPPPVSTPVNVTVASYCPQPSGYNRTGLGIRICFNPLNLTSAATSGPFVRISLNVTYFGRSILGDGTCSNGVCSGTVSFPGEFSCGVYVAILAIAYDANSVPSAGGVQVLKC